MKTFKYLITVIIFMSSYLYSNADDFHWKVEVNGDMGNSGNWVEGSAPTPTDNIFFDAVGDVTVDVGFLYNFNNFTIRNSSNVTFENTGSDIIFTCDILTIDATSDLNLSGSTYIELTLNSAEINGSISLDGAAHKIIPYSPTSIINFNSGSSFTAEVTLTGYPFGDGISTNVYFKDGSNYYHRGGNSPFGSDISSNVTSFSIESNYHIMEGLNPDNIKFTGKTYGNIMNESENSIVVTSSWPSINRAITFNKLTTNHAFTFNGNGHDYIVIKKGIETSNEEITLKCRTFIFDGTDTYINAPNPNYITFKLLYECDTTMINAGDTLHLNTNLIIEDEDSNNRTFKVEGIIDTEEENNISFEDRTTFAFQDGSKLITANTGGIEGSIIGDNFTYTPQTTFEFTSPIGQNTGLENHTSRIGKMIINNTEVLMDNDIDVSDLIIDDGKLSLSDNNTLTIYKSFTQTNGSLVGGNPSSLAYMGDGNMVLNQNLSLTNFTIDNTSATVTLEDGELTGIDYLNILNGTLDLNNNILKIGKDLNLSGGELIINNGTLIINEGINIFGGNLVGGPGAKLQLLENIPSETTISIDELRELEINNNINMGNDLIIHNLLQLNTGTLFLNDNNLTISGECYQFDGGKIKGSVNSSLSILGADDNIDIPLEENTTFDTLNIDRATAVIGIDKDFTIASNLNLTNGFLNLVYITLTLNEGATITHSSEEDSYIITGGGGFLKMPISNDLIIPVGTSGHYLPIKIGTYSGISPTNLISFRLGKNIYDYTIDQSKDDIVELVWLVQNSNITSLELELNWDDALELNNFNNDKAYLIKYNEGATAWKEDGLEKVSLEDNKIVYNIDESGAFAVSSNSAPIVKNQEFSTKEDSPNGTQIGQLEIDYDGAQNTFFRISEHSNEDVIAFGDNGEIVVNNSSLLDFATHPSYTYNIGACAYGRPIKCNTFELKINIEEVNLFVTNYISPNGDGKNDTWIVNGVKGEKYKAAIYDKNGNLVYISEDYKNEWNGSNSGKTLVSGVYYYKLDFEDGSFSKGTITLIR